MTDGTTTGLVDAAVVVQAAHRRSLGWAKAAARVRKQFCRRYAFESGFYYYERIKGGETQWHRPAVLLGTRRRRGLSGRSPCRRQSLPLARSPLQLRNGSRLKSRSLPWQ